MYVKSNTLNIAEVRDSFFDGIGNMLLYYGPLIKKSIHVHLFMK
jgi:hypothetical protein